MADEAFALSPINARAALPTDADYDAIHEAFMETARGRWFLTEYAKRNRNADTRMVLDAVERIEATLASQRQAQAESEARAEAMAEVREQAEAPREAEPQVDLWPELSKAFARARIEIAQRLLHESNDEAFEAIRASTETIRSVSWALRERGFETRICDFLDLQVNAITDGYTGLMAEGSVASETEAEVLAAFDALTEYVAAMTERDDAGSAALDVVVDAVAEAMSEACDTEPPGDDDVATPVVAAMTEAPRAVAHEAALAETAVDPDTAFREIYGDECDIEIVDAAPIDEQVPAAPTEPEINKQRLYAAKVEPYRPAAAAPEVHAQAAAADIEIVDVAGTETGPAPPDPRPADEPMPHVAEMAAVPPADLPREKPASLGEALIASGVIQHPAGSRPDLLAPFRRMSQAEKVALFT